MNGIQGPAQIQLVPLSEFGLGQVAVVRNKAIDAMVSDTMAKLKLQRHELVVRDIRAADDFSDYTYEDYGEVAGAAANVYETMTTGTMGDQRWIGIFGVKDNSDDRVVSALKFNVGGGDRAIWQLQALNDEDGRVGFSPGVIIIPQNAPYTISRYILQADVGVQIVLKGIVVEPRGRVLSP